jgi:hypothetical protein
MDRSSPSVHSHVSLKARNSSNNSASALRVARTLSRLGLFSLLCGTAAAQTPEPQAPASPEAPPSAAPSPASDDATAPTAAAPEAAPAPEAVPPPEATADPAMAPGSMPSPTAVPVVGEPSPTQLSTPPTSVEDNQEAADSSKKPRMFGAMLDLGVPDGTNLSFVFRPISIARVHAGLGYNGVSPGLRIGGEYLPLGWGPSIGMALGHYFEGDANGLAGMFGDPGDGSKLLEHVGYSYFALRAGMEFGGDRFTFFGRGGVTWLRSTIHELDSFIQTDEDSNMTVSVKKDPVLSAFVPTIQLGMIVQL